VQVWSKRRAAVASFDELVSAPWRDGINALCWPRRLAGDFDELLRRLAPERGVAEIDPERLARLRLSPAGRAAADQVLADRARLEALGCDPVVNGIAGYPRDARGWAVAADVCSFHVDRAPIAVDTWLCTYAGAPTEGLDPDDAARRIDDPAVRASLAATHAALGAPGSFDDFLREESLDLHYAPTADGLGYSFGVGNLWRVAVAWPGCPVPACVHRAPDHPSPRLLLIG
jgi:hypothetical protein